MRVPRNILPRFQNGQAVKIRRDVISTVHAGKVGVIIGAESSRYSHTLDTYIVRFPEGQELKFGIFSYKVLPEGFTGYHRSPA